MHLSPLTRLPLLVQAYLLVAVADATGAVVAVRAGLEDARTAVLSGTPLNAPVPFLAVQLALASIAGGLPGRRRGTAAAALLVVVGTLSIASGFADGGYDADLTGPQRAVQILLVAATALTVALAAAQLARARRESR